MGAHKLSAVQGSTHVKTTNRHLRHGQRNRTGSKCRGDLKNHEEALKDGGQTGNVCCSLGLTSQGEHTEFASQILPHEPPKSTFCFQNETKRLRGSYGQFHEIILFHSLIVTSVSASRASSHGHAMQRFLCDNL